MLFYTFIKVLSLALLVDSAAILSPNPAKTIKGALVRRDQLCNQATYNPTENSPSEKSLRDDCQILEGQIRSTPRRWKVDHGQTRLAEWTHGTCTFSTMTDSPNSEIGNDDIADILRDSVADHSFYQRVCSPYYYHEDVYLLMYLPGRLES